MPACNVPIFPAGDATILNAQVTDRRHRLASIKSDWVVRCDGGHGFSENADVTAILGGLFPIMAAPSEATPKQLRELHIRVVKLG